MGTRPRPRPGPTKLRFQGSWVTLGSGPDPIDTVDRGWGPTAGQQALTNARLTITHLLQRT